MTAPAPDDLKAASQIAVFSGLNPRAVQTLLAQATVVDLEPGHALFRQGEPAAAFFIVIEGWIKLYRITPAGDEAVLHVLTKGESFAEAVAFVGGRYPATATAAAPCSGRRNSRPPRGELHSRDAGYRNRDDCINIAASSSIGSAC
jgi:Cyclic nucleotide-binding domain